MKYIVKREQTYGIAWRIATGERKNVTTLTYKIDEGIAGREFKQETAEDEYDINSKKNQGYFSTPDGDTIDTMGVFDTYNDAQKYIIYDVISNWNAKDNPNGWYIDRYFATGEIHKDFFDEYPYVILTLSEYQSDAGNIDDVEELWSVTREAFDITTAEPKKNDAEWWITRSMHRVKSKTTNETLYSTNYVYDVRQVEAASFEKYNTSNNVTLCRGPYATEDDATKILKKIEAVENKITRKKGPDNIPTLNFGLSS